MLIENLLDVEKLRSYVLGKLVKEMPSRIWSNVKIYNYGRECQFDETKWDDVTELCRGLIVDWNTGEVLARPFRKFFNIGTSYRPETSRMELPESEPEVTRKLDGSLGILWRYEGEPMIATRGSFGSAQARWATKFYQKNCGDEWPDGWTPLFEIIYPENRIVVKYDREELVLLAMVNIETGAEMRHAELAKWAAKNRVPVVQLFNGMHWSQLPEDEPNEEGYVLTWHKPDTSPLKVKVKFSEYCRIHRLVTGLSVKGIWEMLRDGRTAANEFGEMPEHFQQWAGEHIARLKEAYSAIEDEADAVWNGRPKDVDRKTLALYFTAHKHPIPTVCFCRLDGKNEAESIWKAIRPKPEQAFQSAVVEV